MQIHVCGDGSLIALADLSTYKSFVDKNWHEDFKLQKHLLDESDRLAIALWGTGFESDWKVEFREGITQLEGVRSMEQYINNSSGSLHLINYDSLTMAAQFEDYKLPDEETEAYEVSLPKGVLKVRIIQLIDPKADGFWEDFDKMPGFILEYERVDGGENKLPRIPWTSI